MPPPPSHPASSSIREFGLILETTLALVLSRAALALLSFGALVRWSGRIQDSAASDPRVTNPASGPCSRSLNVARVIERVARHLPFETTCLVRALACTAMLRRRAIPSSLVLGLRHGQEELGLEAHAWIDVGGRTILGAEADLPYSPVCRTLSC